MPESSSEKPLKVLIDIHIIEDVLEKKPPHNTTSSELVSKVLSREILGVLPGFAIVSIYRKLRDNAAAQQAEDVIDWFLANFEIASLSKELFVAARSSEMEDFDTALMLYSAIFSHCKMIVTRTPEHYPDDSVKVISPEELLYQLSRSAD